MTQEDDVKAAGKGSSICDLAIDWKDEVQIVKHCINAMSTHQNFHTVICCIMHDDRTKEHNVNTGNLLDFLTKI